MATRKPLTKGELHEIGLRRSAEDVVTLLWEIKRLRGIVLRAHQLQACLGDMGGSQGMILSGLRHELDGEPCVAEFPRLE